MALIATCTSILRQRTSCLTILRSYSKPNAPASVLGLKKKKLGGKLGAMAEKIEIPAETDAKKLVTYVCGSNILKTGEDIKIKDDSEYPEWLWTINTGKPPKLEELDPATKQYWRKLRKLALQRNNKLSKVKRS
ncbi:39S ribosomal protein L54, mitochondrial [Pseudolycoriella hygida]|uniref:Large ribosomal subunit protein mL54 n=1 Tax=Pseudolycoriella hygida TaxID=35572 RepID=A0A9Q0S3Q0_9DIPT|nr:39S ribosomal protein L54, mitochondrial [Pseudolycoriella hygida]